jgi:hypothetical protein
VRLTDGEFMTEINSKLPAVDGMEPRSVAVGGIGRIAEAPLGKFSLLL